MDLVDELRRLVSIRTEVRIEDGEIVRENYDKVVANISSIAEKAGLEVEVVELDVDGGKVPTVIARFNADKPSIAMVSHYDVVPAGGPWSIGGRVVDPYDPVLVDGKLYGRGAADDKSAIVASLAALEELLRAGAQLRYSPTVVVTGDEEVGGLGIRALLDKGYRWDRVAILDAGADFLSVGASGVIHGWIKVRGRAGHAGMPHRARNALEDLVVIVSGLMGRYKGVRSSKISKFDSPPGSPVPRVWGRFSFTIIKLGPREGEKHNRVPGEAWAGFDMRLIPEEDAEEALEELYSHFSDSCSRLGVYGELEVITCQPGWYSTDEQFVEEASKALEKAQASVGTEPKVAKAAELGGNDGTFFFLRGMPVVAFGAIRADNNVHAPGEFVYVNDLYMLKEFVKNLVSK